ncbi:MAG: AMP-binding protein [Rhodobiaceae bacterium]|nr:AMP-binding protein [Rhodobiaceae bacterium]MCC0054733.1 AMP-binding protein [Rhodobiaceae bacterium]
MWVPAPDAKRASAWHADGSWGDDTIADCVALSVAAYPDKRAVVDNKGASVTYRELDERASRVAGWLSSKGVVKGDIVTVCLPNWVDTITIFFGILKLGAIINPVPVTYGESDLAFVVEKCHSKALIVTDRFRSANYLEYVGRILPKLGHTPAVMVYAPGKHDVGAGWDEVMKTQPLTASKRACGADEPAAVLFTSGTESKPKGAVHTHNTILFGERAMASVLGATANDTAFMASPVSHATGFLHGFAMTLMLGGTLSLLDVFKPEDAIAELRKHKAMWTMGATPFLADISRALAAEGGKLPDLQYFLCGGAPVPEEVVKRAADSDIRVLSVYGSTESPPHTLVRPQDPLSNAWTSDGRAVPGVEIRIVSQEGEEITGYEKDGEEWSRGPNTFVGYLDEPELTAKALDDDGWVHSGDLARWREDGSIRIVGRIKELIIRGGQNISVREVEEYLMQIPGVRQVAVVGIPHERLGETGCAIFVTDGASITLDDVQKHLIGAGVARFKMPERVDVWTELPMTPSGKIQKYIIRQKILQNGSPE